MADLGLVLVGPRAGRLRLDLAEELPASRVRAEDIVPLEEDLSAMVGYAATGTFHGPDADRWRLLDPGRLRDRTEVLWACAQVQSAAVAQAVGQWDRILLVSWVDEPGLSPAVRALATLKRPVTVLLGGELAEVDGPVSRANQVVLADLLRHQAISMVIHNPRPEQVLDVAVDAARSPQKGNVPRAKPLDIGPVLDLPPSWCMPAAGVEFYQLVHVPMGHAAGLGELAVNVAAHRAIHDLVHGPPVDVAGARFEDGEKARARLPEGDVYSQVQRLVRDALGEVVFKGEELLVEQIDRRLRPALEQIVQIRHAVMEVERLRLQHLRAFTAVGIQYTCQSLSARLDAIQDLYPVNLLDELERVVGGDEDSTDQGSVHLHAWRRAFAGLPSKVVSGLFSSAVPLQLVKERFELFRSEYSSAIARILDELVRRARDPEAPPSTRELRELRDRAQRVRDALLGALARLDTRIEAQAAQAVLDDRFVRWATPRAAQLRQLLTARIQSLPVGPALDERATEALTRRPLGMADDRDFEAHLHELAQAVHALTVDAREPSYEQVLLLVLHGRDPPVLRQALAQSAGAEVELHLERPVEPALMSWLTATGMLVVVAPRLQTCAIYWQRAESLTDPRLEIRRDALSEHRLADLVLPPPEGDTVSSLVGLVRAAAFLLVGLVVGELAVRRQEDLTVYALVGPSIDLPPLIVLPHGALHLLAHDQDRLARLRALIARRLAELPLQADATETVRKLVELSSLGPSPTLAAQVGLYGARFEHLEAPIHALLQLHANLAVASMVDVLHSDELARLTRPPYRRSLLDIQQLGPSGG